MSASFSESVLEYAACGRVTNKYHAARLCLEQVYPIGIKVNALRRLTSKGEAANSFTEDELDEIWAMSRSMVTTHEQRMGRKIYLFKEMISPISMLRKVRQARLAVDEWHKKYPTKLKLHLFLMTAANMAPIYLYKNRSQIVNFVIPIEDPAISTSSLEVLTCGGSITIRMADLKSERVYGFTKKGDDDAEIILTGSRSTSKIYERKFKLLRDASDYLSNPKRILDDREPTGFAGFMAKGTAL